MTREEFKALFERALDIAAENAEKELGRPVPRSFEIELHGGRHPHPRIVKKDDAFEAIYLGPDRFFRVIDISVMRVSNDVSTVYMVVSAHEPSTWDRTWNQPPGSGPFKQVFAAKIAVIE
jgi:hypothetical protein